MIRSLRPALAALVLPTVLLAQEPQPFLPMPATAVEATPDETVAADADAAQVTAPAPGQAYLPAASAPLAQEGTGAPEAEAEESPAPAARDFRLHMMASGPVSFTTRTSSYTYPFFVRGEGPATVSVGLLTGPGLSDARSRMIISLNDVEIASTAIGKDFDGRLEIDVPAAGPETPVAVRAGRNTLTVKVTQGDASCGISDNVWAELRPDTTYVALTPEREDTRWVNPGPDAFVDAVMVRGAGDPKATAAASITASMRMTHHLSRARVRVAVISAEEASPSNADLFISTDPVAEGERRDGKPIISVQQVTALHPNPFGKAVSVSGNDARPLREFGVIADGWEDDLYTRVIFVRLPDTFLSMASGRMRFVMNGSTEYPLAPEATMTVRVNDQISAVAPLPPNWGKRRDWGFEVPMRHVRPGLNRFEIGISTPGETCGISSGGKTALFGDSRIEFPSFGEAERLSITRLLTRDPVYVVMDRFENAHVSLVSSAMMRLARNREMVPAVEIAAASDWLNSRNALIFSTGEPGTSTYETLFGVSPDDTTRWRTMMRQRLSDLGDRDTDIPNMQTWAREAYAYRSVDLRDSSAGILTRLSSTLTGILGVRGVSLQGDDEGFLVARRTREGGTHVLFSVADVRRQSAFADAFSKSQIQVWDGRAAHIEIDQDVRSYRDYGLPRVANTSVPNLRLVAADVMSSLSYLFLVLVLFLATLLGVLTAIILPRKER